MGAAILDARLNAWSLGWTHQAYLSFGQGRWWNSHTSRSQGHRPSPGWLAQTLINRHVANADLLPVPNQDAPVRVPDFILNEGASAQNRELATIFAHWRSSRYQPRRPQG